MQRRSTRYRGLRPTASVVALTTLALLASSGLTFSQQKTDTGASDATARAAPSSGAAAGDLDEQFQLGLAVFMQARCYVCHGEEGNGGAGPRFRENRFLGLADYVIGQVLVGRKIMPSFADVLSDEQIAAVATYIRNAWGNEFGLVAPGAVAAAREKMQLASHPGRQPELSPTAQQPENAPVPPYSPLPPGQPLPPPDLGQSRMKANIPAAEAAAQQ